MAKHTKYWKFHWPFSICLGLVHKCEQDLQEECTCDIGADKKTAERFVEMFTKSGYEASLKTVTYSDSRKTLYSVAVKCKYKYRFDHLTGNMYALMDTRTGQVVRFDRGGRKELAIFSTPEEARGKYGMASDEVTKFGRRYIRVIALKMDTGMEAK